MTATTRHQLAQGTSNRLADRDVGVMNVYEDAGALVVQLAIHDPHTHESERVVLRRDAIVTVGAQQFRIHDITPGRGDVRGTVTLVPEGAEP